MGLEGLLWLVEVGGEFNKFDKQFKHGQSDGLYIMDMIWRLRQLKHFFLSIVVVTMSTLIGTRSRHGFDADTKGNRELVLC